MTHAWDHPEVSLDRTVDAHIKLLRAKLRTAAPGCDPIPDPSRHGYSLKENG